MKYKTFITLLFVGTCALIAVSVFAANVLYQPIHYQVSGVVDKAILKNINDSLLNLRSSLQPPIDADQVHDFYQKAPLFIQNAIKPYGYFRGKIQSAITKTPSGWYVDFLVALGPAIPLHAVSVQIHGAGEHDPAITHWLVHMPLKSGQALNTLTYNNVKNDLFSLATERGYFDAKMQKSQITLNLKTYQADISIILETGPRYQFGETLFSHSTFSSKFLHRFLQYQPNQAFDAKKLQTTQEGMVNSNYFNQVIIRPEPKQAVNGAVPIHISLIPRKGKEYTIGLGYGSDTGIRGTLGLALRHIGHEGHRFHALIRGSVNNSSLITRYMIPGPDPARDLFTLGAGASNLNQSTGTANNVKFGLTYTLSRGHWKNSLTLAYLSERYNIQHLPFTSTQLVYPMFDTKYLNSDRVRQPTRGISLDTQLAGADKNILSRTDFFQVVAHLKTLWTIQKTKTRFLFRADGGHTDIGNLYALPLSQQLFAGGSRSVRGYEYNSIGPGRNLAVASEEIQQRVFGNFYAIGFVDAGVVGNENIFHHINVGIGPGAAWITPVGTIEVTFADAITQSNRPWALQFTMGTDL